MPETPVRPMHDTSAASVHLRDAGAGVPPFRVPHHTLYIKAGRLALGKQAHHIASFSQFGRAVVTRAHAAPPSFSIAANSAASLMAT